MVNTWKILNNWWLESIFCFPSCSIPFFEIFIWFQNSNHHAISDSDKFLRQDALSKVQDAVHVDNDGRNSKEARPHGCFKENHDVSSVSFQAGDLDATYISGC